MHQGISGSLERTSMVFSPGAEKTPLVEPLLTKSQAAKLLAVCPRTVDNLIAAGRLKVVKLGTAARIDPRDLRAFIDAAKQKSSPGAGV